MLTIQIQGLEAIARRLKADGATAFKAGVSAVGKVAAVARTAGVRELAKAKNLPVGIVKSRTLIFKPNPLYAVAQIITLTAGVPLDRLKYRLGPKGISYRGEKFPQAFDAVMPRGTKVLVMQRVGTFRTNKERETNRRKDSLRLGLREKIERVKISLQPEADNIFERQIRSHTRVTLPKIFERELIRRLSRS